MLLPCYSSAETTAATQTARSALTSGIFRKVRGGIAKKRNSGDMAETEAMAETDAEEETDALLEKQTDQWELTSWLKWS